MAIASNPWPIKWLISAGCSYGKQPETEGIETSALSEKARRKPEKEEINNDRKRNRSANHAAAKAANSSSM